MPRVCHLHYRLSRAFVVRTLLPALLDASEEPFVWPHTRQDKQHKQRYPRCTMGHWTAGRRDAQWCSMVFLYRTLSRVTPLIWIGLDPMWMFSRLRSWRACRTEMGPDLWQLETREYCLVIASHSGCRPCIVYCVNMNPESRPPSFVRNGGRREIFLLDRWNKMINQRSEMLPYSVMASARYSHTAAKVGWHGLNQQFPFNNSTWWLLPCRLAKYFFLHHHIDLTLLAQSVHLSIIAAPLPYRHNLKDLLGYHSPVQTDWRVFGLPVEEFCPSKYQ